ncbi:MAG: SRPBCC family protein [Pseudonocardiaceae bacterium]|nr:SRPBCC family protein [Pseudonocardiaceae bacterium]
MPTPYASALVGADADELWQLIRDFNGLPSWHPAIERSEIEDGGSAEGVGCIRRLTLGDGGVVRERLVTLDDTDRRYTYDILDSPFPVRRYRSTIRVAPVTSTGEAFVEWWSEYDADAADEPDLTATFADGVYATGLGALRDRFR